MTGLRYGRRIELVLGERGQQGVLFEDLPILDDSSARSRTVRAQVTGAANGEPEKAKVTVMNPPQTLITALNDTRRGFVGIRAGYAQVGTDTVFAGRLVRGGLDVTREEGGDIKMVLEAMTGGTRYAEALVSMSRRGSPSVRDVATEAIRAAGWKVGDLQISNTLRYPFGYFGNGRGIDLILGIATYSGTEAILEGDTIHLLDPDRRGLGDQTRVPQLSSNPATGSNDLVGSVSRTDEGLRFKGLFRSDLRVGRQAVLEHKDPIVDKFVKQRIVVVRRDYDLSNTDQNWFVTGVGRDIGRLRG